MKTIRQIADEIGVSKTAVNKQIANLGLRSGLRKNGNQFAIDEHQEALIKQAFSEKSQTEIENQSQTKTQTENHEVGDLVCVLQATIDTLQGQLEVKDRQIAKLTGCSSRKESRNGATPGAVWSCKRSLSGGLARAARTGYNNSKNRE